MPEAAFTLLHSDPRFYLLDKAPGVSFHRDGDEAGLMEALRDGLGDEAVWPVHRLDRITSGLILVARSAETAARLGEAFAGREIEKYYLALSDRKPERNRARWPAIWPRAAAAPGACWPASRTRR